MPGQYPSSLPASHTVPSNLSLRAYQFKPIDRMEESCRGESALGLQKLLAGEGGKDHKMMGKDQRKGEGTEIGSQRAKDCGPLLKNKTIDDR